MKLGRIVLKNFLTYDKADIDFSKVKKALIVGSHNGDPSDSNGSGKTNFFESIAWNGWGESKAETIDLNVKHGKDECVVEHHFEHDGKQVSIIRSRNKKTSSSNLDFIIDGVVSNGVTVTDTGRKIKEFLNLDYDTFVNSVYIKQDDVHSLANTKGSNDGRDLLERVLKLDEYDKYYEATKDKLKDLEQQHLELRQYVDSNMEAYGKKDDLIIKIDQGKQDITSLKENSRIAALEVDSLKLSVQKESENEVRLTYLNSNLDKLNNDISQATKELETVRENALDFKSKHDARAASFNDLIASEPIMSNKLRAINNEMDASRDAFSKSREIEDDISKTSSQVDILNKELGELKENKKVIEYQISKMELEKSDIDRRIKDPKIKIGDTCDQCLTDINADNMDHYKGHLVSKLDKISADRDVVNKSLLKISGRINKLTTTISEAETEKSNQQSVVNAIKKENRSIDTIRLDLAGVERSLLDINAAKSELDRMQNGEELEKWKKMVSSKKEFIKTKKAETEKLSTDISSISIDFGKINRIKYDIEAKIEQVDGFKKQIVEAELFIKNSYEQIDAFDIILSNIEEKKKKISILEKDISNYNNLATAFSSRGIRSYILKNAISELEKEANHILQRLSNGRLSIEFKTEKEIKKSKNEKQEKIVFQVLINDGQKTFPFSSYSGGEKFRISFVIRVALSKLLLRRAHSKLDFLIIDEAVSPLDGSGVEKIIEIINDLQDDFKTILVITHRNDIKNYFDETIAVNRNENGSTVQLLN